MGERSLSGVSLDCFAGHEVLDSEALESGISWTEAIF